MKCTARIFAEGDADRLQECLAPEQVSYDRSSFTIKKIRGGIEFNIESKDPVALRATLNAISQMLIVFNQAKK